MFGVTPDSPCPLAEGEWTSSIHPDDLEPIRKALGESFERKTPYGERFRTVHPDGRIQVVLGVGRPLDGAGGSTRFVGWNFDVVSTGEIAADWICAHPEALTGRDPLSCRLEKPTEDPPSDELATDWLLARAKSILRVRRAREQLLCRSMIGEPAFDLLLYLYVRSHEQEISLTSLARPAGIPYTSAMRWIRYLADKGFVERSESRSDRRATCVRLTPLGRSTMDEILAVR